MKHYYGLLRYELNTILKSLILLCVGTIISPLIFLNIAMKDYANVYERFETIYMSSGCIIVFAIYFVALCGICIKSIYSNYWGSKSIYTLLTLPIKREVVYFSKLTTFLISFTMLTAAQFISIFLSYAFFAPQLTRHLEGQVYFYRINNGLFLAFIRSDFFRILLPLGIESFISSLTILITIVCALLYGVLCERSRKFAGFIPIIASVGLIIYTINLRININYFQPKAGNTYLISITLILLSVFFIWHSVKLTKQSSIV